MYKLTVYIDEPDIEPIEIETETPRIETQSILQTGCLNEKSGMWYPPHKVRQIRREVVNDQARTEGSGDKRKR